MTNSLDESPKLWLLSLFQSLISKISIVIIVYFIGFVTIIIALSTLRRTSVLKFIRWRCLWWMRAEVTLVYSYKEEGAIFETLRAD